jgi:hypothetical protein
MPDARYLTFFAHRGFDLLTYKTVRNRAWDPHPFPNVAFVPGIKEPLPESDETLTLYPTPDHGAIATGAAPLRAPVSLLV